ncbi:MAG: hypothetical protein WCV90_08685 [Candidatus Woesearchaeota archaeon]|jgi:hypothetical protein
MAPSEITDDQLLLITGFRRLDLPPFVGNQSISFPVAPTEVITGLTTKGQKMLLDGVIYTRVEKKGRIYYSAQKDVRADIEAALRHPDMAAYLDRLESFVGSEKRVKDLFHQDSSPGSSGRWKASGTSDYCNVIFGVDKEPQRDLIMMLGEIKSINPRYVPGIDSLVTPVVSIVKIEYNLL